MKDMFRNYIRISFSIFLFGFFVFAYNPISALALVCSSGNGSGYSCDSGSYYCTGDTGSLSEHCNTQAAISNRCTSEGQTAPQLQALPGCSAWDNCGTCTSCTAGTYVKCDSGYSSSPVNVTCQATHPGTAIPNCSNYVAACGTYDTCSSCATTGGANGLGYLICSSRNTSTVSEAACVSVKSCPVSGTYFDACSNSCVGSASILKLDYDSGVAAGSSVKQSSQSVSAFTINSDNYIGIGITNPDFKFKFATTSNQVINVAGGQVGGLNSVQVSRDQAVSLAYLQDNYNATTTSFWKGSLAGDMWNANTGSVIIGTSTSNNTIIKSGANNDVLNILYQASSRVLLSPNALSAFGSNGVAATGGIRLGEGTNYSYLVGNGTNLLLNPLAGNVGIGTTNPRVKLEVGTNDGVNASIVAGNIIEIAGLSEVAQAADITITAGTLVNGGPTAKNGSGYWNIPSFPATITFNTRGWWTYAGMSFTAANVHNYPDGGGAKLPASFLVEASSDGVTWTTVDDVTGYTSALYYKSSVISGSGKWVRITATAPQSGETTAKLANVQIFNGQRSGKGPFSLSAEGNAVFLGGKVGIGAIKPLSQLGVLGNASIGATYGAIAAPTSGLIVEGSVGIGVTDPKTKLHTSGDITFGALTVGSIHSGQLLGSVSLSPVSVRQTFGTDGTGWQYRIAKDTAGVIADLFTIQDNGYVGIGSTTPNTKLSISQASSGDTINVGGGQIGGLSLTQINDDQAVSLYYLKNNYNSTTTKFWAGSLTGDMWSANSGNIGIGVTNPLSKLQIGATTTAATITPLALSLGGTYSSVAGANPKLKLFDNGVNFYGMGVSANQFDFMAPANAGYSWNINGIEKVRIDSNGDFRLVGGYLRTSVGGSSGSNLIAISADAWKTRTNFWLPEVWSTTASITIVDAPAGAVVPTGKVHQFDTTSGGGYVIDQLIPIDPNVTYYGKIWAAKVSGTGVFYAGYTAYDKDGVAIAGNGGTRGYFIASAANPASTGAWYYNKIKGEGTNSNQFPVGTRYIKPLIIVNFNAAGVMQVGGFEISDRAFEYNSSLDFSTNGTSKLLIDSSGYVGIGTTTPGVRLSLSGGAWDAISGGWTGEILRVNGGRLTGLNLTPITNDEAVSKSYLDSNFNPKYSELTLSHRSVVGAGGTITASSTDSIIGYTSLSGANTLNIPNCTAAGKFYIVVDESGSASSINKIIIDPVGDSKILGVATFELKSAHNSVYIFCNRTEAGVVSWFVL
ncbi:MAG: beta strand repeat-containing protein [Patescibacteria group bacterium]